MDDDADRGGTALRPLLAGMRRRLWLVAICVIGIPAIVFSLSSLQPKEYTASAELRFQAASVVQSVLGSPQPSASADPARDAATHIKDVGSRDVAGWTARVVGNGWTPDEVARRITITGAGETDIVTVSARHSDPGVAARLADVYAAQYVKLERDRVRTQALAALGAIESRLRALPRAQREGVLGRSLRDRSLALSVLASAAPGGVVLSQRAGIPASPSSPKTARNVAFGVVLGLLLGVGAALLADRLDTRVRDSVELEKLFGRPVLAEIPDSPFQGRPVALGALPEPLRESFRTLRARLKGVSKDLPIRSVLFASADAGEGTSMIARHFAGAAALTGMTTLYVEANLRDPTLADDARLRRSPGLSEMLEYDIPIDVPIGHIIQHIEVDPGAPIYNPYLGSASAPLAVIVAGQPRAAAAELMESERMSELLRELTGEYDLVVLDTPSVLEVSDAIPLLNQVDSVLAVVRVGALTRDTLLKFRQQLSDVDAPVLGVIARRVKPRRRRAPYGYRRAGTPPSAGSRAVAPDANGPIVDSQDSPVGRGQEVDAPQ